MHWFQRVIIELCCHLSGRPGNISNVTILPHLVNRCSPRRAIWTKPGYILQANTLSKVMVPGGGCPAMERGQIMKLTTRGPITYLPGSLLSQNSYVETGTSFFGGFKRLTKLFLNSLTAIRFRHEQKTSAPQDSYGRNSTESTIHHQHNNPQTLPPWRSHLPLLQRENDGSARSDAGNLFRRGWPKALRLGLVLILKITV